MLALLRGISEYNSRYSSIGQNCVTIDQNALIVFFVKDVEGIMAVGLRIYTLIHLDDCQFGPPIP